MMTANLRSKNKDGDTQNKFNLQRYFSVFSIGIIIALTVVLSFLVYYNQRRALIDYSVSSTIMFAQQLNNRMHEKFTASNLMKGSHIEIEENSPLLLQLDNVAETFLRDYVDIKKIKLFNSVGKIVYSTDADDIGKISGSESFRKAIIGQTAFTLTKRKTTFKEESSNRGKHFDVDIIEIYVPIYRDIKNPSPDEVLGAFEIYKDISSLFSVMRREFYTVPLLLIFSMSVLYLFLHIIIKKANIVINKRNEEIDILNSDLEEAQKKIKMAIDKVIENESFHVRLPCDNLLKCWEVKNCEQINCPSYKSENLRCWQVAGTFCGGKVQGYFASKYGDCRKCNIFQNASKDRIGMIGESFNNMMALLEAKHNEIQTVNRKLNVMIDTDPLTQVGNRRSFQRSVENIHLLALRHNRPYSILLCDVDYFKLYNDTYGHQQGDYALVSIANTMKSILRKTDGVFRWGGEEFSVILPEQNFISAFKVAESLRSTVQELALEHKESPHKVLSISIGIASNIDENVKYISWETVLKLADEGLYKAKSAGRNRVFPSPDAKKT